MTDLASAPIQTMSEMNGTPADDGVLKPVEETKDEKEPEDKKVDKEKKLSTSERAAAHEKAKDTAATAGMTPTEIRKLKLKIDGVEEEVDEAEAVRLAQLGKASHKRFSEAQQMRQQVEQFMAELKTNPKKVLTDPNIGFDIKKIAQEILWEQIQEDTLTPEQKKQREIERELKAYKDREQEEKTAREKAEEEAKHQSILQDYDKKITSALTNANLPRTPETVRRVAQYMLEAVRNGYDLEPSDLVAVVRKDYENEHKELFNALSPEQLFAIFGEDSAKKIREFDLGRLKTTTPKKQEDSTKSATTKKPAEKSKKLKGGDWDAEMKRKFGLK